MLLVHAVLVNELVNNSAWFDTRTRDDEWHANAAFVEILLAQETMLTNSEAVVCRKDDVGVCCAPGLLDRVQNSADLRIHVGDEGVVLAAMELNRFSGARKRCEHLIAYARIALVEWVLGEVVRRNPDFVRRVKIQILLRRLPGVVRRVETDIHEERLVSMRQLVRQEI